MTSQTYICPNCGGKGCPVCQNTGRVSLSQQEVEQLQKLMTRTPEEGFNPSSEYGGIYPNLPEERKARGQLAGILTLIFLALVSFTGFASWYFTHNFKLFWGFWSLIIGLLLLKPLTSLNFFREAEVDDFISGIEKEGVKIRLSPFYPLL
ncbi:MAG: hypothetical protein M1120_02510 [Patescibacteria group bacterium]|nr:hypothetical protein [Patescibacteria group bacterium]